MSKLSTTVLSTAAVSLCLTLAACDNSSTPQQTNTETVSTTDTPQVAQPQEVTPSASDLPKPTMTLYQATVMQDIEQVRANIAHGANLNAYTQDGPRGGYTALHAACRANFIEIAKLLIDAGADVDIPADATHLARPLHWAARAGNLEIVKLLVEAGADVNATAGNDVPKTPMEVAMDRNHLHVVEYLGEHGGRM